MEENTNNVPTEAAELAASLGEQNTATPNDDGGNIWDTVSKEVGYQVKGPDELRAALERGEQSTTYKSQIEELKAQLTEFEKYKPVNEFQKKLSELYRSNADQSTIRSFIKLNAGYEPSNHEETLKFGIKFRNPGYSDFDVESAFAEMVGELPDRSIFEEEDRLEEYERLVKKRESLIRRKAINEQKFLDEQKASFDVESQPAGAATNAIDEQSRARLQAGWKEVVGRLGSDPIQFEFEDKSIDGKYEFQWDGFDEKIEASIQEAVIQQAVQAGLDFTPENLDKLRQTTNVLRKVQYAESFQKAMVQDLYASLKEAFVRNERNVGGIRRGTSSVQKQAQPKRSSGPRSKNQFF